MKVLLIYPRYPETFWSFRYALRFTFKKATHPPLGLLTIASYFPKEWKVNLIDMNVEPLKEEDLKGVDLVVLSGMYVQKDSAIGIINKCKRKGIKLVAGGPLFTTHYNEFEELIDHFVLNEGEVTFPQFLKDLQKGTLKKVYTTSQWADLKKSPIPSWNLIKMKYYTSMGIQYSRGCPFNCEFCDVTRLFGHQVRTKDKEQIIAELEALYQNKWRGSVFFVDDNFIGSKKKVKEEILPAIIEWQEKKGYPFYFYTQVSINLADDEELMKLLVKAGFNSVFIGIETPNEESLAEAKKVQNLGRDLVESIKRIQKAGLEVMGGFIVGFDNDPPSIFDLLINFIEKTKIVIAMVGLLNAPPGTNLYKRLEKDGRIRPHFKGTNTDLCTNIIPKMDYNFLIEGYKKVIRELYNSKNYYQRIKNFIKEFYSYQKIKIDFNYLKLHYDYFITILKSFWKFGILDEERRSFWDLILYTVFKKPRCFPLTIWYILCGYHFRKIFKEVF